ncbi:MAG: hypothetical protein Q9207_003248 [Kuettlingeria erythrocarpa]
MSMAINLGPDVVEYPYHDLTIAGGNGDLSRVHELYSSWFAKQKPDPDTGLVRHRYLHNAAQEAAAQGHWPCLNYMLSCGVELYAHIIAAGVRSKSVQVLEGMLARGWDINRPQSYDEPPFLAYSPAPSKQVLYADCHPRLVVKDEATVRWFLAHGADPNAPAREWDVTPLSYAANRAPLSVVKLMFEHGGSATIGQLVNHASDRDDADSIPVLQLLVDHGAPTNEWLFENRPDLHHWAAAGGSQTGLYYAAEAGLIENVRFLLKHGADPRKRGIRMHRYEGRLPIDIARWRKHEEVVQLLDEAAAELERPKTGLWTLLGWK